MHEENSSKREHGFWGIFFIIFGLQVLGLIITIAIASAESGYGGINVLLTLLGIVLGLPLLIAIIYAIANKGGSLTSKLFGAAILSPIMICIIGAGACFAVVAAMSH